MQSALNQLPIETKIATFVVHAWKVWGTNFQENTSNGSLDTVEKALHSPTKLPLISYQSHQNVHCLYHKWSYFGLKISVKKGTTFA